MTPPATANGRPLLSPEFVALLRQRERQGGSGSATADAPHPEPRPARVWHRPDGDTVIRIVAATAVLAVAAIAAVVSYSHIYDLARHHGESGTAARLLPVSVDGLIASASLALLHAARNRITAPWMAYLMLWLGVGATIAANVGYGLPAGWLSAVIAAWPAMAFVGSVEMALMLARNERRTPPDGGSPEHGRRWRRVRKDAPVTAPDGGPDGGRQAAIADTTAVTAAPPSRPPRRQPGAARSASPSATKSAKVDAELAANPHLANADIARRTGASERTVERRREAARKAAPKETASA